MMYAMGTWLRVFARILAVAAAYYLAGRLGLLLAIPPGFAAPVWPPAGIALVGVLIWGYRVWPGILIGSFFLNVGVSLDLQDLARSVALGATIGAGASLQACAGGALIRRVVGFPTSLDTGRDVITFLGLGGPVASLVNATIGTTALLVSGSIGFARYPFSWWNWWVGDVIGVLTVAPLILVFVGEPKGVWRGRRLTVALPLAVMIALSTIVFVRASAIERDRIQRVFDERADHVVDDIARAVRVHTEVVRSVSSFFRASEEVLPEEFATFTEHPLADHPGIRALSWNPRVTAAERASFEAYAQRVHGETFAITETDDDGSLRIRSGSPEYFPVLYVEPVAGNHAAIGFDLGSESVRQEALGRARATGDAAATSRVQVVQEHDGESGFLVFVPTSAGSDLAGFAVGSFIVEDVVRSAVGENLEGMALRISDGSVPPANRVLFSTGELRDPPLTHATSFDVADRRWTVVLAPGAEFLDENRSLQAWVILAAGLLFGGLLGMSLLALTGRTARVEDLVTARTAELRVANRELERARADLESRVRELARSNAELERFAYVASHDLQEPLRSVAAHTQMLQRRYGGQLGPDADESIRFAVEGAIRMQALIDDLLDYSRLGRSMEHMAPVDVGEIVDGVRTDLDRVIRESGAEVLSDGLPVVLGNPVELRRLFLNLIDNAIKFAGDEPPKVTVSARRSADRWEFSITDAGIGFEPQYAERIFRMFERLHPADAYPGTGMGLAIVQRVVELHGGRVWAESTPGVGTALRFTLPAADEPV